MLARRTLLRWLAAATGGFFSWTIAAVAGRKPVAGPPRGSHAALRAMACKWFFDCETGEYWHADDIFQSMDWHLPEDVMERARRGLADNIGPEQLAGLERRRRRLQYVEFRLPYGNPDDADAGEPAESLVTVYHWRDIHVRVRPFLEAHGLDHANTAVRVVDLVTKVSSWATGDEYIAGRPLCEAADIRAWLIARGDRLSSPDAPTRDCG